MHARTLAILTTTILLTACAGRLESTVQKRAASDFGCSAEQVQVESQAYSGMSGTYVARGCGQEDEYTGRCGLIGICSASRPSDMPPPTYASSDAGGSSAPPPGGSSAPPPSADAGGSSAPAQPATPSTVSVTLRNTCGQKVDIFFGDKPKFGSGTYSSLGSNTSTSKSFSPGDMVWIVDESQNGIASATVQPGMRTVEITGNCDSISAN